MLSNGTFLSPVILAFVKSEEQVSKDQYMDLKDASESIINDAWEHIGGRPGGQFKI